MHKCVCESVGHRPVWDRAVSPIGIRICRGNDPAKIASYFGQATSNSLSITPTLSPGEKSSGLLPCLFRGEPIREKDGTAKTRWCGTCGGGLNLKLYACSHPSHGPEVTAKDCAKCPDRKTSESTESIIDADTYITTERLIVDAGSLVASLPPSIDAVVGIARSGLLPATAVATRLHIPLWHVGKNSPLMPAGAGWRMNGKPLWSTPTHVLLIDDTAASGGSMREAMRLVTQAWPDVTITRAVIYAHPTGRTTVDVAVSILPGRHFLEWNWPNTGHAEIMAFDFDGILCHDIAIEDCDDGQRYERALENAKPLHLPRRRPIPLIVTARHERFRQITEAWLTRHGVRAQRLVMRDWSYPNGQHDTSAIARWKADHYKRSGLSLFAESDPTQSRLIAELAKKPVLCPAAGRVIRPTARNAKPRVSKGCRECHGARAQSSTV